MPKHRLFYYTGTGNSLWVARELAKTLGDAELTDLVPDQVNPILDAEAIGIVFPVHMWGPPKRIVEFVNHLPQNAKKYFFAVAVNAGEPAATLLQLEKLMAARGLTLSAGFSVPMPSNYIPWGGPGPMEKLGKVFTAARAMIPVMAKAVQTLKTLPMEKGPWWQNLFYSKFLYPMSYPYIYKMDKDFWADEKCNGCGVCARICPMMNIRINNGRPEWQHHCEQCLACIQWCPREAIQYGKNTPTYPRYHHPEIKVKLLHHWRKDSPFISFPPESSQSSSSATGPSVTPKYRVLVMEDEEDVANAIKYMLEQENYEVLTVHHPDEALRCLSEQTFNIMTTDIQHSGIDGLELVRKIRTTLDNNIPIVVCSASYMNDSIKRSLALGADDFIVKPFEPDQFINIIKITLEQGRATDRKKTDIFIREMNRVKLMNR